MLARQSTPDVVPTARPAGPRVAALIAGAVLLGAAAFGALRQRPAPDAWVTAPTFPSLGWWTTAHEQNGFLRLPALSRPAADVAAVPGRSRAIVVGADATIAYTDDDGATWRLADLDLGASPTPTAAPDTVGPRIAQLRRGEQTLRDSANTLERLEKAQRSQPYANPSKQAEQKGPTVPDYAPLVAQLRSSADSLQRLRTALGARAATPAADAAGLPSLTRVVFDDSLRGWAVGGANASLTTDDGGAHWRRAPRDGRVARLAAMPKDDAWRVTPTGGVERRAPGGGWTPVTRDAPALGRALAARDDRRAVEVGERGVILATDDGGRTWMRRTSGTARTLRDVAFADDLSGVAVGDSGTVLVTHDGGATWEPGDARAAARVRRRDPQRLVAADGDSVLVAAALAGARTVLSVSRDSGATWTPYDTLDVAAPQDLLVERVAGAKPTRQLWLATADGLLHVSPWLSRRWSTVDVGAAVPIRRLALAGGALWAGGDQGTVLRRLPNGVWAGAAPYRPLPAPWVYVALAAAAGCVAYGARPREAEARRSVQDTLVSDRPISRGDADALGLRDLADAVSRFLRNTRTEPPLTLAVTGPWGSGKSSLMNLVREDLESFGFRPVTFNAWHHQKEDHLLAALLQAVRSQGVPPLLGWAGLVFRARLVWLRGRRSWRTALVLATGVVVWGLYFVRVPGAREALRQKLEGLYEYSPPSAKELADVRIPSAHELVDTLLPGMHHGSTFIMGVGIAVLFTIAWRTIRAFGTNPAQLLVGLAGVRRVSDLEAHTGLRHRFAEEFREVTTALAPRTMPIFVDDLDRCHPKQVLEVLEAISFLVTSGDCFVVLGMDRERVERCVGIGFKDVVSDLADEAEVDTSLASTGAASASGKSIAERAASRQRQEEFAQHYLEKLVNVEVPVPHADPHDLRRVLDGAERRTERRRAAYHMRRTLRRVVAGVATAGVVLAAGLTLWHWMGQLAEGAVAEAGPVASAAPAPNLTPVPNVAPAPNDVAVPAPAVTGAPQVRGAVVAGAAEPPSRLPLAAVAALALVAVGAALWPVRQVRVHDSDEFTHALDRWTPVVYDGLRDRATPRGAKRFLNRVRFYAMRQREDEELLAGWITGLLAERAQEAERAAGSNGAEHLEIPEPALVGLSAVELCWPQALASDEAFAELVTWRARTAGRGDAALPDARDWELLRTHRQRFVDGVCRLGVQ
jgi:photosystem II stability/assembly factor-like uncharacterized protein